MKSTMVLALCFAVPAQLIEERAAEKPSEPARYWYGNPLKEGTARDVQAEYAQMAFATLDASERIALDKLKAVGFKVLYVNTFKFVVKDAKRVVIPPRGIALISPEGKERPKLTSQDFAHLAELRHVEMLELSGLFIGNDTLDLLGGMDELCVLTLINTRGVTDEGLPKLGRLKALRRLYIAFAGVTDAGMAALAALPALEKLSLDHTKVTNAGMAALAKSPTLRELSVAAFPPGMPDRAAVGDAGIMSLARMPRLGVLSVEDSLLTDKGLSAMGSPGNFPGLLRLDLKGTAITDVALATLHNPKALPALKFLGLERTQVTLEGVLTLQKARPGLEIRAGKDGTPFESTLRKKK